MLNIKTIKQIDVDDWDDLVVSTYGKPYSFQQQEGCQSRGVVTIWVPGEDAEEIDERMPDKIPFKINGEKMGVKFDVWLNTIEEDIIEKLSKKDKMFSGLFWDRNFYPDINVVANDLYKKGLIEAGEYNIKIDW